MTFRKVEYWICINCSSAVNEKPLKNTCFACNDGKADLYQVVLNNDMAAFDAINELEKILKI